MLLPEPQAAALEALLRERLTLDPHGDAALAGAYAVSSLYFDTEGFDVFHRQPGHRQHKFRLRRYGAEPTLFLERKSKRAGAVRKRRVAVDGSEAETLLAAPPEGWPGAWFAQQVVERGLRPVCRVGYRRLAFIGASSTGPTRVTMDRAVRGAPADGLSVEPANGDGWALLDDEAIVEFKYLVALPALFKELMETLRLTPRPVSKYRRCAAAAGFAAPSAAPSANGHPPAGGDGHA